VEVLVFLIFIFESLLLFMLQNYFIFDYCKVAFQSLDFIDFKIFKKYYSKIRIIKFVFIKAVEW
jgi:hypothetical protein